MSPKKCAFVSVSLFVLLLVAVLDVQSAQAQATFSVAGAASTMTKIGYAELAGPVTFTVVSGTTAAGTIEFFLPNVTLTATSGITVTGSGGLTTASLGAVVPEGGVIDISIPSGATAGSSVTLSGVRVSAVGATFDTLTAAISSTNNSVFAGQNRIAIATGFADGMTLKVTGDATVSVVNNTIVSGPGNFQVTEGWVHSFSSAVGVAGQTAKTQIIMQVIGLPDNVSLTFPGVISSDNGDSATLVTKSGGDETLTNQSTTNRVVYIFNDSLTSANLLDSFTITPAVGLTGSAGTGTAFIQVAMGPIGAAVPNTQYPSTDVPRFSEVFLPPVSTVPSVVTTLFHPVPLALSNESWSISNTTTGGAVITARARLEDGTLSTGVANEVTINVPSHQTTTVSLKDIFGSNAAPSGVAAVEFSSVNNGVVANGIGSSANNRLSLVSPTEQVITYLPFDRTTSTDVPTLTVENTSENDIPAQITLRSSSGASIVTVSRTVKTRGAVRESFSSLFSGASIPSDGYVIVRGVTGTLRSVLLNHPSATVEAVPSLTGTPNSSIVSPFFVFGGGFNTVVTLINASDSLPVRVSVMPYSPAGVALASQPFIQTITATQRQNFDFAALFGQGQVASGYFSLTLESSVPNPFATPATIYGIERISIGGASTVVPLVSDAGSRFFLTPVTENADAYTGISVVNSSAVPVSVTFEAFSAAGASLGTNTINISNGVATIQLLRELIPQFINQDGGTVKITTTGNVRVLGFRGTLYGAPFAELLFLRGETTP
jgi:hypothetical protein